MNSGPSVLRQGPQVRTVVHIPRREDHRPSAAFDERLIVLGRIALVVIVDARRATSYELRQMSSHGPSYRDATSAGAAVCDLALMLRSHRPWRQVADRERGRRVAACGSWLMVRWPLAVAELDDDLRRIHDAPLQLVVVVPIDIRDRDDLDLAVGIRSVQSDIVNPDPHAQLVPDLDVIFDLDDDDRRRVVLDCSEQTAERLAEFVHGLIDKGHSDVEFLPSLVATLVVASQATSTATNSTVSS